MYFCSPPCCQPCLTTTGDSSARPDLTEPENGESRGKPAPAGSKASRLPGLTPAIPLPCGVWLRSPPPLGVLLEERLGVFAALAEPLAAVLEPGAVFSTTLRSTARSTRSPSADALVVHDVEFGFAERRRDLVLHDLHARAAADHPSPSLMAPMRRMSMRTDA